MYSESTVDQERSCQKSVLSFQESSKGSRRHYLYIFKTLNHCLNATCYRKIALCTLFLLVKSFWFSCMINVEWIDSRPRKVVSKIGSLIPRSSEGSRIIWVNTKPRLATSPNVPRRHYFYKLSMFRQRYRNAKRMGSPSFSCDKWIIHSIIGIQRAMLLNRNVRPTT